jgi:hypothetical protein
VPPNQAKARDAIERVVEPPRRARMTTSELHALSMQIKAQREAAELNKQNNEARPKPKK